MAVSSSVLFHFTKQKGTLEKILKSGFWPRYSIEDCWRSYAVAVPIVCFCDIPLLRTKEHVKGYGSYGLGMSKEWAMRNKITPVFYVSDSSLDVVKGANKMIGGKDDRHKFANEIIPLLKPYEALAKKTKKSKPEKTCFYNEREWRYVLQRSDGKQVIKVKDNIDFDLLNKETEKEKLTFEAKDIKYILISNEKYRLEVINLIDKIFSSQATQADCELLKSRIVTIQQINDDF